MTVSAVGVPERVIEAIEGAGHAVHRATPASIADDASVVVTAGEQGLREVATGSPSVPVLALDTGIGPAVDDLAAIREALADGREYDRPLLDVSVGGESVASALYDVTLVTSEPARISEYAIGDARGERVAAFRADGIVVATPAGSLGYAAAAGGPALSPSAPVVCAVPIAPFHTQSGHWVLESRALSLSVLREEGAVSLLVDGTDHGSVEAGRSVGLVVDGRVRTLHPRGRELETL